MPATPSVVSGVMTRTVVVLRRDAQFKDESEPVRARVRDDVVTLTGRLTETALVPAAARWVRGIEGVVDVHCALTATPRT
ncbi:BON domain-containing protein [Streptomyces fuscichromogenes]|uniref:BON domain-containing protein n=1 Tax=Streptomyces fuscichromogenes TaxID=1324013 RepID=UPI0037FA79AC